MKTVLPKWLHSSVGEHTGIARSRVQTPLKSTLQLLKLVSNDSRDDLNQLHRFRAFSAILTAKMTRIQAVWGTMNP